MNGFYVVAIVLAVFTMVMPISSKKLKKRISKSTTATVTSVREHRVHKAKHRYRIYIPTLRFYAGGQQIETEYKYIEIRSEKESTIGDSVPIRYDPANPSFFVREKDLDGGFGGYAIMVGIILLFIVSGAIYQFG